MQQGLDKRCQFICQFILNFWSLPHPNLGVSIDHHWYPSPRITPSLMYTMARHQPLAGKSSCHDLSSQLGFDNSYPASNAQDFPKEHGELNNIKQLSKTLRQFPSEDMCFTHSEWIFFQLSQFLFFHLEKCFPNSLQFFRPVAAFPHLNCFRRRSQVPQVIGGIFSIFSLQVFRLRTQILVVLQLLYSIAASSHLKRHATWLLVLSHSKNMLVISTHHPF